MANQNNTVYITQADTQNTFERILMNHGFQVKKAKSRRIPSFTSFY